MLEQFEEFKANNAPAIADARIKAIPIVENHEPLVDVRAINHKRIYMLSDPATPFASPDHNAGFKSSSMMRASVFEKLQNMLTCLDALTPHFGYRPGEIDIVVFEGLRDILTQKTLFQNKRAEIQRERTDLNDEELDTETSKWVSPTKNNIPVHSTGAAVDIKLLSKGSLIDLGKFGAIWGANPNAPTFSEDISDEQKNNRLLLLMAAKMAGLTNYLYEFWHFSFGDRYAAFWKNKDEEKVARYNSIG